MSLPKLPPFENKNNTKINSNAEGGNFEPDSKDIPHLSLPMLPNIDGLELSIDSTPLGKEPEKEEAASLGLPELTRLPFLEDIEKVETPETTSNSFELTQNSELEDAVDEIENENNVESKRELRDLEDKLADSLYNLKDIQEDERDFEDEGLDISNKDVDWDSDFNDDFSFLPTMDSSDLEEDFEEDFESNILPGVSIDNDFASNKSKKADKTKGSKSNGFKELDDESAKEFFNNLKANVLNKFTKKGSRSKIKKTENKPKDGLKNNQDKKPKIKKAKANNKLKGTLKIIYMLILVITIGLTILFISKLGGHKTLEDMSTKVVNDTIAIQLKDFHYKENGDIALKITNEGDMSVDFLLEATFKTKTFLSFKNKTFVCQSDIVALESAGEVEEILHCDNFEKDSEYKLNIELIEIK